MMSATQLARPITRSSRPGRLAAAKQIDPVSFLVLPASLYMMVAFAAPLVMMTASSFTYTGEASLANYVEYFSDPYNRDVVFNTIKYATVVSIGCLLIGFPFAYFMARASTGVQVFLLLATVVPLTSSIIVKSFGWTILLKSSGVINGMLMAAGVVDTPPRLLFTELGLYIGSINIKLPFMILPIFAVLRQIPPNLAEAASCLGAGPIYTFFRVTVPLSVPGVIAGLAFVFCQTAAAYAMPLLLIGERFKVMANQIVTSFQVFNNIALGSTVSVTLLVILGLFVAGLAFVKRESN